jgi:hypothetical protein
MRWDIDAYNREYLEAEKRMLLFNIALLRHDQPPHFMMLSAVAQTRSFSAGASFQWSHVWNSLLAPFVSGAGSSQNVRTITPRGSDTYAVGPFTAAIAENPTFTFTPIQGQDFAGRFESPLPDKLTTFLEDVRWGNLGQMEEIVEVFADSLVLQHGDVGACQQTVYENKRDPDPRHRGYKQLWDCVRFITHRPNLEYTAIDAIAHQVPTVTPEDTSSTPAAADVVSALQAGYEWAKKGDKTVLTLPVKLPAWFDYDPKSVPPPRAEPLPSDLVPVSHPFWLEPKPRWENLAYSLPPKYKWWRYDNDRYALLPDGYGLDAKTIHTSQPTLREEKTAAPSARSACVLR